ncbi:tetratricopeptide repeat protein [Pseudodesulfovibrio alkaliphilus]|nr:tetratricopeptide repeat protein [Pseudodesulfovibrio alkaliphilus]
MAHSQGTKSKQMLTPPPSAQEKQATPSDSDSALRLARLLCEQGGYEGALGVYAQLDKRGGMKPLELLEYANIASLVSPPRETLSLFMRAEKALAEEMKKLPQEKKAELYTGLGRARMAVGQYDLAQANLEKALDADPQSVAALNALGVLLDTLGDHEAARKPLIQANELDPADVRILNNLALSYLSGNDPDQAIRLFNQARSLSDSPSLSLNMAFTFYLRGQEKRARASLREFMPSEQCETFMGMFAKMQQRIDAGESTISEEMLRASGKLIAIHPPAKTNDVGANVLGQDISDNSRAIGRGSAARAKAQL